MQWQIGAEPRRIISPFEMTGCFLAVQAAKTCRVTGNLPINDGQRSGYQEITEQVLFPLHFLVVRELIVLGSGAGDLPVEPDRTSAAIGDRFLHSLFILGYAQLMVITLVNACMSSDQQNHILRIWVPAVGRVPDV